MAAVIGILQAQRKTSTNMSTCKTVILPVDLYGSENWSLVLSEDISLRGLANRALRQIFVANR